MFKIRFRITSGIDELKTMTSDYFDKEWNDVGGFVEITIGRHKEGYYHENPLQDGEVGGEWVGWWLSFFQRCANHIQKTKYVAFREPETYNRWLEFKLIDDIIVINVAQDIEERNKELFIYKAYDGFTYVEPMDFEVGIDDFLLEIYAAKKMFLDKLRVINPELLKTKMALELLGDFH
jgi:hypothetical protein